MTPETKKPAMLLQPPLGIYLPAGATLQFGKGRSENRSAPLLRPDGCLAEYAVTDAEIAAMLKATDLTISVSESKKENRSLLVPVAGFSAAYAKIK